jgi:hypothetical protein
MPLFVKAETYRKQPERNMYMFEPTHKAFWKDLWYEFDGDKEKLIEFAKEGGVSNPEDWFEELHRFLFSVYSSDCPNFKTAAKASFSTFLKNIVEKHIKDPYDKHWYLAKGVTERGFIKYLERAALLEDDDVAAKFLNSKIPDFGYRLYSEFILMRSNKKKDLKSIASATNKRAYELEKSVGFDLLNGLHIGDKVEHILFPNEVFSVVSFITKDNLNIIAVEDQNGNIGYVFDKWNVTKM